MVIINKNILVYPHLEWKKSFETEDNLYKHVDKVISNFNLDITFWTKNSFTLNDEGFECGYIS